MSKNETTIKRLNPKGAEVKYVGFEPEWNFQPDDTNRISKFANAFQWYQYHYGKKDAKDMIAMYLEINHRKSDARLIRGIPDSQIRVTPGWVCRMSVMGLMLNEHEQCILDEQISLMLKSKQEVRKAAATDEETQQVKLTIQDHLREKASECAGELEGMFDDFIVTGAKMSADFKPIALIRGMNISPQMIPNITKVWDLRLAEFNEVLEGVDEQLVEGYSHLSKAQLKQCVKFCETVLQDCTSYISIKKVERKPRAKKSVSPEKQASKFKYLKDFAEFNLKSQSPASLVNASEAFLYDSVKRKLVYVVADTHIGTFTVKGSAVIAYDAQQTVQKTLRKPEGILKELLKGGKPAMRKVFKDIKATEVKWNGRGNDALIILKVW